MTQDAAARPDDTAVRTALWRALHLEIDALPHVLVDEVGLQLVAPDRGWQQRPDMSAFTKPFRASILARARFIEDLAIAEAMRGIGQYVILGAGLDTFAQRRPAAASHLTIFEIDRPAPQAWKRRRLMETGLGAPANVCWVPVDFEAGDSWWEALRSAGFDSRQPALVACTGVSMYLTLPAVTGMLRQVAGLAAGSTFVMSFLLPMAEVDEALRVGFEKAAAGALAAGTPFMSFFTATRMLELAREAGFRDVRHVSSAALGDRYFAGRGDGLLPPRKAEELLVATP